MYTMVWANTQLLLLILLIGKALLSLLLLTCLLSPDPVTSQYWPKNVLNSVGDTNSTLNRCRTHVTAIMRMQMCCQSKYISVLKL